MLGRCCCRHFQFGKLKDSRLLAFAAAIVATSFGIGESVKLDCKFGLIFGWSKYNVYNLDCSHECLGVGDNSFFEKSSKSLLF